MLNLTNFILNDSFLNDLFGWPQECSVNLKQNPGFISVELTDLLSFVVALNSNKRITPLWILTKFTRFVMDGYTFQFILFFITRIHTLQYNTCYGQNVFHFIGNFFSIKRNVHF